MLLDLIKDAVELRSDDFFHIYQETENSLLNERIINKFIKHDNANANPETTFHLNIDDSGMLPSLSLSLVNSPIIKNTISLVKLTNETSIKFNKTNVNFHFKNKKPLIVITSSFFFFDDLEDLLFDGGLGYFSYEKDSVESKKAIKKLSSIIGSMIINTLETSMFIDEKSINSMTEMDIEDDSDV